MNSASLLRIGAPLLFAWGVVSACGSSAEKKRVFAPPFGDAGEAGEAHAAGGAGGTHAAGGTGNVGEAGESGSVGNAGEAGAASLQGGASGEAGASSAAGATSEAGAAGVSAPFNGLYVGLNGLDGNDGTRASPFRTLTHALSVAQGGDTVVLLDGSYAAQPPVTVPDGVALIAEHSGAAQLACQGASLLSIAGSSQIDGIEFDNCGSAIAAIASGTLTLSNLYFKNCGSDAGAVQIGGTVVATLSAAADHIYADSGSNLMSVRDTASLTVTGGVFKNLNAGQFVDNAAFRSGGFGTLVLKDVVLVDLLQPGLSASNFSNVTLDHTVLDLLSHQVIFLHDSASFTTQNQSRLALKPAASDRNECIRSQLSGGSISITDTEITGCSSAIDPTMPPKMSISGSNIHDNDGLAMDLSVTPPPEATFSIRDTKIVNNGAAAGQTHGGMRITAQILHLKFRGVTFNNNGGPTAGYFGAAIAASAGSTLDFGTLGDPGLNTFLTNGVETALFLESPSGVTFPAIGNTWLAGAQGTNAQGQYAALGAGAVLEATGPVEPTGAANYRLNPGVIVRLAQNP